MRPYAGYMYMLLWAAAGLSATPALAGDIFPNAHNDGFSAATTGIVPSFPETLAVILVASLAANLYQYLKGLRIKNQAEQYKQRLREAVKQRNSMAETLDQLNDYVFFHDTSGGFYEFNAVVQNDSGYSQSELRRMNIRDLVPERFKHEVDQYLERIREKGEERGYMRIVARDGNEAILEYNTRMILDKNGAFKGIRGIARNVTQQHLTRRALKESEKKYRNILETIEDGYYEVDLKGQYKFLNNAALRILGYTWEEVSGKSYKDIIPETEQNQVFETFNYVFRTGRPLKAFHWRALRGDGTECHLETSVSLSMDKNGNALGFQGIIRDITERIQTAEKQRELEEQLQQAQKMESIGTLAGGIAHDFNNILFPMIGYTELAMQDLPPESQAYQNLERVIKSSERAKSLVQQILNFSRQSTNQPAEPVYIQPVIKETLKLLKNTIPSSIEVNSYIQEDTGKTIVNPARVHQVIMNLCMNAYQAMESLQKGDLNVVLRQAEVTEESSPRHHHVEPGTYLCLAVSDTGAGIPQEIREKIFEPYFTTKPQEKGTGLGLSVSYGIIKNAGGTIAVDTEQDKGSTFYVYMPVAEENADAVLPGIFQSPLPTGKGCILLVDDEHQIVELERQMLENLGYEVVPRTSSVEALEAFRHNPGRFDLMITDQTMPNKSGIDLIKEVRKLDADLPVILCTGYSERVSRKNTEALAIEELLLKPISKNHLAWAVNKALRKAERQKPAEAEKEN
ncbi:MAG: PAS domain-containing hybrid sensor histidine kinase/response regulator [Desulfosalsimonas sp.]